MEFISKSSIKRIARKSGVKNISDDCYITIYDNIDKMINDIIKSAIIINNGQNTKTLMLDDIYNSFEMNGYKIAKSDLNNLI